MVSKIRGAKKSLLNLALSTAIALSPVNSFSAGSQTVARNAPERDLVTELSKDEKIEITKATDETYDAVQYLLSKGDYAGAKGPVDSMIKAYSNRTNTVKRGVKDQTDTLFSVIDYQKSSHQKVLNLVNKADSSKRIADLEQMLYECKDESANSVNKNEIKYCDKITPAIVKRQSEERTGREKLDEIYTQMEKYSIMGNIVDLLNSDARDNLTESRKLAKDLGTFASKVEEISKNYKINDKETLEYISGWKKASADNLAQIESLESDEMKEIREKQEKEDAVKTADIKEVEGMKDKYGFGGHPFELGFENFSKTSSGQTPATYSGFRFKFDGAFNRTSFGTKALPSLKDLLYSDVSLAIENGSGDIPEIGSISSKNGREIKMHVGGKFFGEKDMFMYAGPGFVTGNEEQNFSFNSGISNAWKRSYNGIGAQIGFQSNKTGVKVEYSMKNNSVAQEISRAGIKLLGESSKYNSYETVLSASREIAEGLDFKGSYRYETINDPNGKNNVSDIKVGLAMNPAAKFIKNKAVRNVLKDTRFNITYENESGKGYTSRGWNIGVSQRFGPVYHNKNSLRK